MTPSMAMLGNDSVVKFTSGEGNGSVLKGFTITGGNSFFNAGGITINNSSPIQRDTGNQTCDSGAGMQVQIQLRYCPQQHNHQ